MLLNELLLPVLLVLELIEAKLLIELPDDELIDELLKLLALLMLLKLLKLLLLL